MSAFAEHSPATTHKSPAVRRFWGFVSREPLVHFIVLAGILFAANGLWSGSAREQIVVDRATQDFLMQQQQDLLLRDLTLEEKQAVIDTFIEEEILVREAYKQGFDKSGRVRSLLLQNMRFFLSRDLPQPTEADLMAYFAENKDRFTRPASLTLDHVFFGDPDEVPAEALKHLRNGGDPRLLDDDTPEIQRRIARAGQKH